MPFPSSCRCWWCRHLCHRKEGRKENGAILSINLVFVRFTLPKTNIAPENGWLEYDRFLLGWPTFRGELLVSGSVSKIFLEGLLTVRCHRVYYSQWCGNFGDVYTGRIWKVDMNFSFNRMIALSNAGVYAAHLTANGYLTQQGSRGSTDPNTWEV